MYWNIFLSITTGFVTPVAYASAFNNAINTSFSFKSTAHHVRTRFCLNIATCPTY